MRPTTQILIPPDDAQQNYKEVRYSWPIKGREVTFCLLPKVEHIPKLNAITSAAVVPLIGSETMVAVSLERGLDIPGGHLEAGDKNIVDTIRREAYEEACIHLAEPLYLIGIISSDYYGKSPEQTTYMAIAAGRVASMGDFTANFESTGREVVLMNEFLTRYNAGSQEIMREIIKRANTTLSRTSQT